MACSHPRAAATILFICQQSCSGCRSSTYILGTLWLWDWTPTQWNTQRDIKVMSSKKKKNQEMEKIKFAWKPWFNTLLPLYHHVLTVPAAPCHGYCAYCKLSRSSNSSKSYYSSSFVEKMKFKQKCCLPLCRLAPSLSLPVFWAVT